MKLSSAILVSALLVVAMPTSAHDVSGYPGNPIEAWDCGETRVELNKHATRSFDLYSLKGSPSSGRRVVSTSNFLAPTGKMELSSTASVAGKLNPIRNQPINHVLFHTR